MFCCPVFFFPSTVFVFIIIFIYLPHFFFSINESAATTLVLSHSLFPLGYEAFAKVLLCKTVALCNTQSCCCRPIDALNNASCLLSIIFIQVGNYRLQFEITKSMHSVSFLLKRAFVPHTGSVTLQKMSFFLYGWRLI